MVYIIIRVWNFNGWILLLVCDGVLYVLFRGMVYWWKK